MKPVLQQFTEISERSSRQQAWFRWLAIAGVFTLAGFGLWQWAWLLLGAVTFSTLADSGLAITLSLLGLVMEAQQKRMGPFLTPAEHRRLWHRPGDV